VVVKNEGIRSGSLDRLLANAFFKRDNAALQLNDTKGYAIDIYHDVGAVKWQVVSGSI
jgi:hypothetical protein